MKAPAPSTRGHRAWMPHPDFLTIEKKMRTAECGLPNSRYSRVFPSLPAPGPAVANPDRTTETPAEKDARTAAALTSGSRHARPGRQSPSQSLESLALASQHSSLSAAASSIAPAVPEHHGCLFHLPEPTPQSRSRSSRARPAARLSARLPARRHRQPSAQEKTPADTGSRPPVHQPMPSAKAHRLRDALAFQFCAIACRLLTKVPAHGPRCDRRLAFNRAREMLFQQAAKAVIGGIGTSDHLVLDCNITKRRRIQ